MDTRAYVLVEARVATGRRVLEKLVRVPGVITAELVEGPFDLIALVEGDNPDIIARRVMDSIHTIEGVLRTFVCYTFQPMEQPV